jgi:protein required for attachment to host cells
MKLPKHALVVAADGKRCLYLEENETRTGLRVTEVADRVVEPNASIGTDRPGRFPVSGGRRETVEETDWHRLGKETFAAEIADSLAATGERPLVVLADPRTLGAMRAAFAPAVARRVVAEIAVDVTNQPVEAIAAQVAKA